ncbi:MAG TPA: hypothetical protein VHE35_03935, partial [Kofleriaceae bacterium]|nr:hypothetical protein [Kofleriaceae bacterium]
GAVRGLPTVQVLPAQSPPELMPLVLGLHDELLRRLARRDHLRLLRGRERELAEGAWVLVASDGEGARITIRQPGRRDQLELRIALEVDALVAGAELAGRVIAASVGAGGERGLDDPPMPAAARAYLWRALERGRHDELDRRLADDDYAAAAWLAGDDPRVMAGLAMSEVRRAFFSDPPRPEQLTRAIDLATRAITAAPHAAEAQLAYGRVLLHLGDVVGAAVHLRTAMARAPFLTDPHEWLGRLLLEAGFLAEGMDRMREVLDMDPDLEQPRWALARAHALEGRWDHHDALLRELDQRPGGATRLALVLRTAAWRGDLATMARIRAISARQPSMPWFERSLIDAVCDATIAGRWAAIRDQVLRTVTTSPDDGGTRRRAFLAQIICEVAAASGDLDAAIAMLELAVDSGLFDRHWLERCPLLVHLRHDPRYPPLHAQVRARAHAILDAFYGDAAPRRPGDTEIFEAVDVPDAHSLGADRPGA